MHPSPRNTHPKGVGDFDWQKPTAVGYDEVEAAKVCVRLFIHETIIPAISKGDQMVAELRVMLVKLLEAIPCGSQGAGGEREDHPSQCAAGDERQVGLQELLQPTHLKVNMPAVQAVMETKTSSRCLVASAIKQNKWWAERHVDLVKSSAGSCKLDA